MLEYEKKKIFSGVLMSINQVIQKNAAYVTFGILLINNLIMNPTFVMVAMVCQ